MKFKFLIVQTVEGGPDPSAYPLGLAENENLQGAGMTVVEEFDDVDTASSQGCDHEDGHKSKVWCKHCPPMFKHGRGSGGLDVFYIGPVSDEETDETHKRNKEVLGDAYIH